MNMSIHSFFTKNTLLLLIMLVSSFASQASLIFINEIHYDNNGADRDEFVEVAGTAGLNLLGWSLLFYNGSNGLVYKTITISNITLENNSNGFGFLALNTTGIQNGANNGIGDGIAISDNHNNLMQFISYEGAFEAKNGAALGVISQNISLNQNNSTIGQSLQLTGNGKNYQDFSWSMTDRTFGSINTGQKIMENTPMSKVVVSEPNLILLLFLAISFLLFDRSKRVFTKL